MKLLLDTHSFLWFIGGDKQISDKAKELISDENNDVFLSIGSLWEIAIKTSIGKLELIKPFDELIPEQLEEYEIELLDITQEDLNIVVKLPLHHRDPFDRIIIAQAIHRGLDIVGKDRQFEHYDIAIHW